MSGKPAEGRSRERRTAGHRLEVILDVSRRLMSGTDLDALLHPMAEAPRELLASDRATIFIVDRYRGQLWSRIALGTGEIRIPLGTGIAGTVAETALKHAWPKPGDEGMGTIQEAAGVSERDRVAVETVPKAAS